MKKVIRECPGCGEIGRMTMYGVACLKCGFKMESDLLGNQELIDRWNTRSLASAIMSCRRQIMCSPSPIKSVLAKSRIDELEASFDRITGDDLECVVLYAESEAQERYERAIRLALRDPAFNIEQKCIFIMRYKSNLDSNN